MPLTLTLTPSRGCREVVAEVCGLPDSRRGGKSGAVDGDQDPLSMPSAPLALLETPVITGFNTTGSRTLGRLSANGHHYRPFRRVPQGHGEIHLIQTGRGGRRDGGRDFGIQAGNGYRDGRDEFGIGGRQGSGGANRVGLTKAGAEDRQGLSGEPEQTPKPAFPRCGGTCQILRMRTSRIWRAQRQLRERLRSGIGRLSVACVVTCTCAVGPERSTGTSKPT